MTDQPATLARADSDPQIVADLMSPALAVFGPEVTVAEATEALRELTRAATVTYCYVVDEAGKLIGVVVMVASWIGRRERRGRAGTTVS